MNQSHFEDDDKIPREDSLPECRHTLPSEFTGTAKVLLVLEYHARIPGWLSSKRNEQFWTLIFIRAVSTIAT